MNARWSFYATVAVVGIACAGCFLAGSAEWADRQAMVGVDSAEAAEQAQVVLLLYAIGAVNVFAFVAFLLSLLRRSGWGWWLVLGTQAGIFAFALIEGVAVYPDDGPGWFFFSGLPLLTLLALVVIRLARARLEPPAERNLAPHPSR